MQVPATDSFPPAEPVPRPLWPASDRRRSGPAGRRGPLSLRVVAADADPTVRTFYRAALPRLGHRVLVAETGPELVESCRLLGPDLVLTADVLPGLDGLTAAAAVHRERPAAVVLVADAFPPLLTARALAAGCVLVCLTRPVREPALGAALAVAAHQFELAEALRAEVAELRQALEDRKVIERAKGAVARRCRLEEAEAYARLRAAANSGNQKLVEVASRVLAAEAAFREVDAS